MSGKIADVYYEVGYKVNDTGLKKADGELRKVNDTVKRVDRDTGNYGKTTEKLGSTNNNLSSNLKKVVGGLVAIKATAIGSALALNKLNESYREVDATITHINAKSDATMQGYEKIKQGVIKGSKELNINQLEIAKGYQKMAMAGWSVAESNNAIVPALNLVKVSGEDTVLVLDIVTDQMSALGYSSERTTEFVDMLGYASSKSNVTVGTLGETLKYISPVSKLLNVDANELTASIMALGDEGIKASQAGTTLKAGLLNMVNPTKEQSRLLKRLRIELKDSKGEFIGISGLTEQLSEKTKGMTDAQKAQTLSVLFGKEAVTGWAILVDKSTSKLKDYNTQLKNSKGFTEAYTRYLKTTTSEVAKETRTSFDNLKIAFGEVIDPYAYSMLKDTTGMFERLEGTLRESQPTFDLISGSFIEIGEGVESIVKQFEFVKGLVYAVVPGAEKLAGFLGKKLEDQTEETRAKGREKREKEEAERMRLKKEALEELQQVGTPAEKRLAKVELKKIEEQELKKRKNEELGVNKNTEIESFKKEEVPYNNQIYGDFTPQYNFGNTTIQIAMPPSLTSVEDIKNELPKMLRAELELRDKRLLNQLNPRNRI